MREIDSLFDDLRAEIVPSVTGPEPSRVIGRARARRNRRLAAGAAAALVAVGLVAVPLNRDRSPEPLTPTPTVTATVQQRVLKVADLLYAPAAKKGDEMRWWAQNDSGDPLAIPYCGGGTTEEEDAFGGAIPGAEERLSVSYNGNKELGNEATSTSYHEQLIIFTDIASAQAVMSDLRRRVGDCEGSKIDSLPIGDEAFSAVITSPQHDQGVAFRKGRVIAVYGDYRDKGRPLKTMGDHVDAARTMAERLASYGY